MKVLSQDPHQIGNIKNELDEAIDAMDVDEIEKLLAKLSDKNPLPCPVEDSKLFAKRIINQNKKGYDFMKKSHRKFAAIAASLILTICVGLTAAYAAGLFNKFTFFNKDTTVIIKTNQNISDKEAKELANDAAKDYNNPSHTQAASLQVDKKSFSSIDEIKETFGIDIVVPSYIPKDFEMDKEIQTQAISNFTVNIYTTYTSNENPERRFAITVIKENLPKDNTHITVTDSTYKDVYTTPSGTQYTLFDEDGGIIATTEINDIQYALCFMGVSEDEIHKVINSADLSMYAKENVK